MSNSNTTRRLTVDGLSIEVEPVTTHHTIHGARGPRVYVRIRAAGAEPGRDAGPRTSLSLTPRAARLLGQQLQSAAGGAA